MRYLKLLTALFLGASMLVPAFALAQSASVDTSVGASVGSGSTAVSATVTTKMKTAMDRADKEIDRRIAALNDLNTRVQAMERVTADFKNSLSSNIQNQITGLTQLKAKIDADTDLATLKTDIQTIAQSYRIFMLVMPQSRIAAAADREVNLITMMNTLGSKLQARIAAEQSAGKDVGALLSALTDMSDKLKDANTQAQAAVSVTATLTPDNGDKTKMAQNATALKTGRSDIQAAQKDLVAARKDVETILSGLKATSSTSATTTTSTH